MDAISKCPFCGNTEEERHPKFIIIGEWVGQGPAKHQEYRVHCRNCGAAGPNELTTNAAVERWNMRRESMPY